jgi:hypothetical protein
MKHFRWSIITCSIITYNCNEKAAFMSFCAPFLLRDSHYDDLVTPVIAAGGSRSYAQREMVGDNGVGAADRFAGRRKLLLLTGRASKVMS